MGKISTTPLVDSPLGTDRLPVGRPGNTSARTVSLDQVKGFAAAGLAADSAVVHQTGDETITGQKRFGVAPIMPSDVCFWMDGQSGRPTLAAWQANKYGTNAASALQAAIDNAPTNGTVTVSDICAMGSTVNLPATRVVNLAGVSITQSQLVAWPSLTGAMIHKPDGWVADRGSIKNLLFNANKNAATALQIDSYRTLDVENLCAKDCKGTAFVFGYDYTDEYAASNTVYFIGIRAVNINVDNTGYVQSSGVAVRPDYGIEFCRNVADSTLDTGVVNHIKVAGMRVNGPNNRVTRFHPWGWGPNGSIADSWPQYGIAVGPYGTVTMIDACEFDTIQTAGVYVNASRTTIMNCLFVSSMDTSGHLVVVEPGKDNLTLVHNRPTGAWNGTAVQWYSGHEEANCFIFDNGWATGISFGGQAAVIVGSDTKTGLSANLGTTTLYSVPAGRGGQYRVSASVSLSQAATSSSTLPACAITYTDADTNTVRSGLWISDTSTANTLGSPGINTRGGVAVVTVKEGTAFQYATSGYVSSGATPMQYSVRIKLEYMGA